MVEERATKDTGVSLIYFQASTCEGQAPGAVETIRICQGGSRNQSSRSQGTHWLTQVPRHHGYRSCSSRKVTVVVFQLHSALLLCLTATKKLLAGHDTQGRQLHLTVSVPAYASAHLQLCVLLHQVLFKYPLSLTERETVNKEKNALRFSQQRNMSALEIQLHSRIFSSHTKHKLMFRIMVLTEKIHNHQRNTYLCSDTSVNRILGSEPLYFTRS